MDEQMDGQTDHNCLKALLIKVLYILTNGSALSPSFAPRSLINLIFRMLILKRKG